MTQTDITIVQERTFETIRSAVNKMVDFIRPTYGPAGNKVIISKVLNNMIIDDGVQIARDFELPDPAENAVVKVIRETAVKTNDRVGDGTTSSLIMLQGIMNEIYRRGRKDGRSIEIELRKGFDEAKAELKRSTKKISSKDELKKVAMVSFDDEKTAEMVSDIYAKLGSDATITIDRSPTMETTCEMAQGVTIDRGYLSPYMISNPERMETVIENPHILITDYRMTEANDIIPIMDELAKNKKLELVILCNNLEGAALATAIVNRMQGKFFTLAVATANDKVFLEDLAILTGAKFFSEAKGDKLDEAKISDLGRAKRIIAKRNESVIVGGKGNKEQIAKSLESLKKAAEAERSESDRKSIQKRIATMTNTVAVIKVGAPTENEQKALKYKVEDAVNAVKAAGKGGVVCGAGMSLARIKTSSPILNEALKYPARQLQQNMGIDIDFSELKKDDAYNVVTGETGDFMKVGVMDPVDVLVAGVESAVSIAGILVTSSGMIVETERKPKIEH